MQKHEATEEKFTDADLIRYITACKDEADAAKESRMRQNEENYDMFHMRHDFSHKKAGQSREILSKQRMAVSQITSFFQQALADLGEWWRVVPKNADDADTMPLSAEEIQKLTNYELEKANYYSHVGNAVQSGLLGSLMITKTGGRLCPKPRFTIKKKDKGKKTVMVTDDKSWELMTTIVPQANFYPDPIPGRNLYDIEEMFLDLHEIKRLSKGDDPMYDKKAVDELSSHVSDDYEEKQRIKRETDQDTVSEAHIPRVKIWEFWGDVVDQDGSIIHENVVITIANEKHIIRQPEANPLWHQKRPYTVAPLIEVANSVWHYALMDAPTKHSRALIELYNLILDSTMKAVHGINQLRVDALDDPSQISGSIPWGTTLKVNSLLQPGMKVMESVVTGEVPQKSLEVLNLIQQELNSSSLTNDLRQGVMPFRAVKATEVVEASQTITSVFQGIAKNVEARLIQPELEKAWQTVSQNLDKISKEELQSLFGKERGEQISQMSPEMVFVNTVNGVKFQVFGVSMTLSKAQDFRKLTTLLQTIVGSEVLLEEFVKKYDFSKVLGEIMTSLDIDKSKMELPEMKQARQGAPEVGAQVPQPDQMSQTPGAGAGSLADIFSGGPGMQSTQFPGSRALVNGNQ